MSSNTPTTVTSLVLAGALTFTLACWRFAHDERTRAESLATLYDWLIPLMAGSALAASLLVLWQQAVSFTEDHCRCTCPRQQKQKRGHRRFGRKSWLLSVCGALFAGSCFYRSLNVADEGAAACRGTPTAFNAPVSGRAVATVGEVALVVQVSLLIEEAAERLGAKRGLWAPLFERATAMPFSTVGPAVLAEVASWSGVLSSVTRFYCVEYVLWMVIAATWAWDAAEILHRSRALVDRACFAYLLVCSLALVAFNALHEIPHFNVSRPGQSTASTPAGVWACSQDRDSPLWFKRLPFFVCYFVGAAWSSAAASVHFLHVGTQRRKWGKRRAAAGRRKKVPELSGDDGCLRLRTSGTPTNGFYPRLFG
eukprot:g721.t1